MARPQKLGLDYFSMDVDLFERDDLHFVIAKHGAVGRGVIASVLMAIFGYGYCMRWHKRDRMIFSSKINTPLEVVETIVNDAINEGFFHRKLFDSYGILTSKWIQETFEAATSKRKNVPIKNALLLFKPKNANIGVFDEETPVKGEETPINSPPGTQSKVKESKVKESIDRGGENLQSVIFEIDTELIKLTPTETASLVANYCNGDYEYLKRQVSLASDSRKSRGDGMPHDAEAYMRTWIQRAIHQFNQLPGVQSSKSKSMANDWFEISEEVA